MLPFYENFEENLEIYDKKSSHMSPHLHKSLECVYVTEGTLELGVGQELHHMEKRDFAIVFPEMIHHYQVFDRRKCRAIYLLASVSLFGGYSQYVLLRVFSGTFHMNFNNYLNQVRLEYACGILKYTDQTITEAYENAGFGSQRTFNRVFFERYRMSPRDYRKMIKAHGAEEEE